MNKLSESDIDWLKFNCTPDLVDRILGFEKDAEKYKQIQESDLLKQYRERGQKIHELSQLKKRLKKEIEEIKVKPLTNQEEIDFETDEHHAWMKRELLKIYEGKENETN